MGRFIVEVVFAVELEDVTQGGKRLHELSHAASALGFEMRRGQVREDDGPDTSPDGWTAYAPE
jgi:hypothetical protein